MSFIMFSGNPLKNKKPFSVRAMMESFFQAKAPPSIYQFSDRQIPLKIVEHSRTKRFTLRLEPGARCLRITVPTGTKNHEIHGFVHQSQNWLAGRLASLSPIEPPLLKSGSFIPFLGIPHHLVYSGRRGITKIIHTPHERQIAFYGEEAMIARKIKDFLKKQAEEIITPLVETHSHKIGCQPRSIRYKDTISRWGSCSFDKRLCFSWRILMAPFEIIDYLAAHEVAHMVEMNHGPKFWALCEQLCPGTKAHRIWLKQNGHTLHSFDFNHQH